QAILALHAIPGKVSAGDALNAGKSKAMGGALEFGIEKGLFKVNGATILKTDIECDNGVIHVIDTVILPKKGDGWKKPKTKTAMNPIERIEKAIDRGVPVFNSGDHAKCAAIYREALSALCKDKKMDSKITKAISEILERADKTDSVTTRAWLLRSGLDNAYSEITRR
ncbi:MAG: fasciclin domain-containing protein, partial [Akkermansiaceae bacterium]